jgi:hypothetical protein
MLLVICYCHAVWCGECGECGECVECDECGVVRCDAKCVGLRDDCDACSEACVMRIARMINKPIERSEFNLPLTTRKLFKIKTTTLQPHQHPLMRPQTTTNHIITYR